MVLRVNFQPFSRELGEINPQVVENFIRKQTQFGDVSRRKLNIEGVPTDNDSICCNIALNDLQIVI